MRSTGANQEEERESIMKMSVKKDQHTESCPQMGRARRNMNRVFIIVLLLTVPSVLMSAILSGSDHDIVNDIYVSTGILSLLSFIAAFACFTDGMRAFCVFKKDSCDPGEHAKSDKDSIPFILMFLTVGIVSTIVLAFSVSTPSPQSISAEQETIEYKENQMAEVLDAVGGGEIVYDSEKPAHQTTRDYIVEYEGKSYSVDVFEGDDKTYYDISELEVSEQAPLP